MSEHITGDAPALASFHAGVRALVFGASGGIGAALTHQLAGNPRCAAVYAGARAEPSGFADTCRTFTFDLTDEASIANAVDTARADGPLDLVIVATGILHDGGAVQPEKSWRAIDADAFARVFALNVTGPALIAKHALPALAKDRKAVFAALSARVGSISDNRLGGWHAYRASKAALNQVLRTVSIELARKAPQAAVIGLHPGTVDTGLSKPFQGNVPDAKLFTPAYSASQLLAVIDQITPAQTGRVFAWDGAEVPA